MQARFALVFVGLASLIACGTAPDLEDDGSTASKSTVMSTSDILNRAQEWVNDKVPYCGGPRGGADVLCGGTCNRPAAAWDAYRSDCSGFVSWTWQITDDPSTDGFIVDRGGDNGWSTVAIADLAPGDALVCDGHIKLFAGWADDAKTQVQVYEESDCGLVAQKNTQKIIKSSATHFTISGDGRDYHPIRRSGVSNTGGASGGGSSGGTGGTAGSDSVGEGMQTFLFPNQQHYMTRGANGEVAHAFWDGADSKVHKDTWSAQGQGIAGEPTTLVTGTQQHVWARGTGGSLEHWFWDATTNQITHDQWAKSGLASDPTSALTGGGQHVWATDTDGKLQHWYWVPGADVVHNTWGTGVVGKPTAMPQDPAQHVFARGTGGSLEHYWWEPSGGVHHDTWAGASTITSEPAARLIGSDQHVWAVDAQGALQHWFWSMTSKVTSHDTWADSGLATDARPSVMVQGDGQHVFARGKDGAVEHIYWAPNAGIKHDTWGQGIATNPSAILIGNDEHVFAQDAAGAIQHWWWSQATTSITHDTW